MNNISLVDIFVLKIQLKINELHVDFEIASKDENYCAFLTKLIESNKDTLRSIKF